MRGSSIELGIGIAAILATLAVYLAGSTYLITVVFLLLVAYVLAQSWDWVGGELGYINLGHYVFFGVGAYAFSILLVATGSVPISLIGTAVFGVMTALVLSVPLFRLRGDYFAFGTLALLPLAELLAHNLESITGGAAGIALPPRNVLSTAYILAAAFAVLAFGATLWLARSRFGFGLRAIRNDEEAAEVLGVRAFLLKAAVFCLSAMAAACAGALYAWQLGFIEPSSVFGIGAALAPVAMAFLGGSGLVWGPFVGALLLGGAQSWLTANLATLQYVVYGTVVILIGRFMPTGLLRSPIVRRLRLLRGLGREHGDRQAYEPTSGSSIVPIKRRLPLEPLERNSRPMLECRSLTHAFAGNIAVNDVSITINQGEIVGLVGANGSGKTTLFNCVSRVFELQQGELLIDGVSLRGRSRAQIAGLGVGRTYQLPRPFSDLTVRENIAIPIMYRPGKLAPARALLEAEAFARYVHLGDRLSVRASQLSIQERKALELARALACAPKLLLVDEVASGLTPAEVIEFTEHMRDLRDTYGITIVWVEHIFSALERVVDRMVVLERGSVIADGSLHEVMRDERVLESYLGPAVRSQKKVG